MCWNCSNRKYLSVGCVGTHVGSVGTGVEMAFWDRLRRGGGKKKAKKPGKTTSKAKKKRPKTQKKTFLAETKKELSNWQMLVESVQDHPLSQARIINTKLLEQLTQQLEQINTKLDALDKLDIILEILQQGRKELESKGIKSVKLDKAIKELERITVKDTRAMKALEAKGAMTADMLAKELKIDRSTASTRLNRLFALGLVSKEARGKKIYYEVGD
jgi:predicted HTH transcriptional regulator